MTTSQMPDPTVIDSLVNALVRLLAAMQANSFATLALLMVIMLIVTGAIVWKLSRQ